jgi:hypothetical protein
MKKIKNKLKMRKCSSNTNQNNHDNNKFGSTFSDFSTTTTIGNLSREHHYQYHYSSRK